MTETNIQKVYGLFQSKWDLKSRIAVLPYHFQEIGEQVHIWEGGIKVDQIIFDLRDEEE